MYDHFKIYTKSGKYKDTYVAFVRYDMKIKDIYTEVPGLGTLYVKNGFSGKLPDNSASKEKMKSGNILTGSQNMKTYRL